MKLDTHAYLLRDSHFKPDQMDEQQILYVLAIFYDMLATES